MGLISVGCSFISSIPKGQQEYTTAGTYTWVAPTDVYQVSVVCIGGGGGGSYYGGGGGGGDTGGYGGGGGSGYIHPTLISSGTLTSGNLETPGNNSDSDRGTAGAGGNNGVTGSVGSNSGNNGKILFL